MSAVLFVSGGEPPDELRLLSHQLRVAPSASDALLAAESVDVIVVDARTDLASARATCQTLSKTAGTPVLLLAPLTALAVLSPDWGFTDFVAAGRALVEQGWVAPGRLAAEGGSLAGAAAAARALGLDCGPMGGFESEEFLAPMEIGEDTFAQSPSGKAWNVEALTTPEPEAIDFTATPAAEKRPTPEAATIDKMVEFANANHPRSDGRDWQASDILKNVVIAVMHPQDEDHDEPWRELVVVGVPGDRTVDMKRLEAQFTPAEIEEATDEDLKKHPELVKGYIGPMALGPQARDGKKAENASETGDALRYLIDAHVARGSAWFTGADEQDVDYYDLVYGRDFEADGTVEVVQVRHGDMSPDGSGPLSFERGVEIGQVFQLGLKYSNALGLKVLDQNGKTVPVWMGSYGIGVSRVMACIAETHHDEKGLAWPAVIAPAQVHVVATGKDAAAFEAAEQLIGELEAKGIEVIFDDRKKVSPGVKFKDAELIGVPIIAVAGRDTVNNGTIEVRDRNGENAEAVPVADAAQAIADRVAALLK